MRVAMRAIWVCVHSMGAMISPSFTAGQPRPKKREQPVVLGFEQVCNIRRSEMDEDRLTAERCYRERKESADAGHDDNPKT
jgi:hypothetical protein